MEISTRQIMDSVSQAPVFQREIIENGYRGISIKWPMRFRAIRVISGSEVHVSVVDSQGYPWAYFFADLQKNPELKLLKEDEKILVEGIIEKVYGHSIDLKDCSITYPIPKVTVNNIQEKWHEKPLGIILIGVIIGVIIAGIVYIFGWN